MDKIIRNLGVVQNLGLFDRMFHLIIGIAMLGGSALHLYIFDVSVSWHGYAFLLSVYPLMSAILGWDPLYAIFHAHSCSVSGKNSCGTVPYQVDAMLGHKPIPDHEYDHSLIGSHHTSG